jgi:ParB family transcriptional regulator, chromosome partitioning protein
MSSRRVAAIAALQITTTPAEAPATRRTGTLLSRVPVAFIEPDPDQPRQTKLSTADVLAMAASMAEHGQLQPIRLRPTDDPERFILVDGEQRWRAATKAEMPELDAVIDFDLADKTQSEAFLQGFLANLHRTDLTRVDVAHGIEEIKATYALTNDDVARRLHRSVAWVEEHTAYLALPEATRHAMDEAGMALQLAKTLRGLPEENQAEVVARVAELPGRPEQLAVLREAKDAVRHGAGHVVEAVEAAVRIRAQSDVARSTPRERRRGRPRKSVQPFEWRSTVDGTEVLAFNRVALKVGSLSADGTLPTFIDALTSDLASLLSTCYSRGDGQRAWEEVGKRLRDLLDRPLASSQTADMAVREEHAS